MSDKKNINHDLWDREIREALRHPVADPGPQFTRAVVKRIEEEPRSPWWLSSRALLGATATAAVIVIATLISRPAADPGGAAADEIRSLAREQRLLQHELEDLQRLRRSATPVVYLAGDENLEFVYALNDPHLISGEQQTPGDFRTANR